MDALLAPVATDAHKYTRGVVGIVAGSESYPGAAVLCVGGARRGGAGYVRLVRTDARATQLVLHAFPDVVLSTDVTVRADAWVIGSGMTRADATQWYPAVHDTAVPLVVDGGALGLMRPRQHAATVVTPHAGELEALGFTPGEDRVETARAMARALHAVVVLKGPGTVIASPDGAVHVDDIAGPELATAGTGDILAGLIGSMLASWRPADMQQVHEVVVRAVTMHGLAGRDAAGHRRPVVATDVLESLGRIALG